MPSHFPLWEPSSLCVFDKLRCRTQHSSISAGPHRSSVPSNKKRMICFRICFLERCAEVELGRLGLTLPESTSLLALDIIWLLPVAFGSLLSSVWHPFFPSLISDCVVFKLQLTYVSRRSFFLVHPHEMNNFALCFPTATLRGCIVVFKISTEGPNGAQQ